MFGRRLFGHSKPKNVHSLENLKYLYNVLLRHQTVTESNRALLVETLRSISEIMIWGDQNDSSVFDYFLEKNMLVFFLRYLEQKSGQYICVQLLQTLNILFENISNETSIYFLLSNNHVNSIIRNKYDFSDEEVMAYYISFMKTLSLKLNKHTIHFFFNEQSEDFTLYTEALKFFDHSESMVRIAVRTITLNVYRVDNPRMQAFIREKTAVPYFSNLVWYMGNHILELDSCVRHDVDHKSKDRLMDLVAEHLDHLHYLNDILMLGIEPLNNILTDYLLNRLYVPLYVNSLIQDGSAAASSQQITSPKISSSVALFLLSQVFLILHHQPLVRQLVSLLLGVTKESGVSASAAQHDSELHPRIPRFIKPDISLCDDFIHIDKSHPALLTASGHHEAAGPIVGLPADSDSGVSNTTDDEKQGYHQLSQRPYMRAIFDCLDAVDSDYNALLALCLLYAIGENTGINQELLDSVSFTTRKSPQKDSYNDQIVERLMKLITLSSQFSGKVRLATLELSIMVLNMLVVMEDGRSCLHDNHLAALIACKEESMDLLRTVYRTEEMFLDLFEDEHREMTKRRLNVEYLTMDASILLQPTNTPLTGIEFTKRLPCGEVERVRKAIRVYFHIRKLLQEIQGEEETQLPLTKPNDSVKINDVLDLNNSDLIGCTVVRDGSPAKKERRFLVIDVTQLIMVEPDASRLGWGVVRFAGYLQDVEVTGDKTDSRCLHISIHKPASTLIAKPIALLTAKFVFDDHIRCMAAKQRLTKGRNKARQRKMLVIGQMLDMRSTEAASTLLQPSASGSTLFTTKHRPVPGRVAQISSLSPRSRANAILEASVPSNPDVSKADACQALNSSSCDDRDSSRRLSDPRLTPPLSDTELTEIPLAEMSMERGTQAAPAEGVHKTTEVDSIEGDGDDGETTPDSPSKRGRADSGLIFPFGSAVGDLKDV